MDEVEQIAGWLRDYAADAGAKGYVFGLSGGVDSACVAALCRRAVDGNALAAWLPCHSLEEDATMARLVARAFRLRLVTVDLSPVYNALVDALPPTESTLAAANIKPRLRMAACYALAQSRGYLVAGGGNRTEIMVGYFTKYGDSGVDVLPLGDLYKHEVRVLARELGVPQAVIDRAPTAGLWPGQTDEGEMGITYETLDGVLAAIESGQTQRVEPDLLRKVEGMIACTQHKRALPPICRVTRVDR